MNAPSMNEPTPLSAALDQIAAGAARTHDARVDSGVGIDVAAARTAARRGRTRYGAVTGLAAAAVLAAVALGGSALLRDDHPLPPVDSPTDTPTTAPPSPTEDAAWPSAVTLGGAVPGCGEPMPALVTPAGEPEITIEAVVPEGPLEAGGVADVGVTITGPEGFVLNATSGTPVLVRDGVVVATKYPFDSDSGTTYTTDTGVLSKSLPALDVVRCEKHGGGAVPLEAGTYDLYVIQQLVAGDLELLRPDESIVLAHGPVPVTVEAPVDPHPAVDDLVVATSGVGPLTVGVPMETNPGAAMLAYDSEFCITATDGDYPWEDPGRWYATYDPVLEFAYYGGDEEHGPFKVSVDDGGVLERIDVWTDRIETSGGIHLGSTLAELQAAHPDVVEATAVADWSRAWVLRSDAGTLVFETIDWFVEGTDVVTGIRVFGPDVEPVLHATDSGDVAGTCSG